MSISVVDDVKANELAYQQMRAELERTHWHQWVVIVQEQLIAVASARDEALRQAGSSTATLSRLVRKVGEELPKVVRKL